MELFDVPYEPFNLLPFDGEVYCYPAFFNAEESIHYFNRLMNTINWKQDAISIHGKKINLPRLTAWYGETSVDYSYSGINNTSNGWTTELLEIKKRIEDHSGIEFNSVLLNLYRNGNDSVSWHRDKEKVLRKNPVIGSVSFGATRTFKFRHINNHALVKSIDLKTGTYLLMKGETQHFWEHHIPKQKNITEARINLTFRILNNEQSG
jgi:alkylated DNA repair dioxygenase AlkB